MKQQVLLRWRTNNWRKQPNWNGSVCAPLTWLMNADSMLKLRHCSSTWTFLLGLYINMSGGPVNAISSSEYWWVWEKQMHTRSPLNACKLGHSQDHMEWKWEIESHMGHHKLQSYRFIWAMCLYCSYTKSGSVGKSRVTHFSTVWPLRVEFM